MKKKVCKYCIYWNPNPVLVDPKKIIKSKDPAIDAISKKLNEYRAKSGECTRHSPFFTVAEYEQWSAVQNDYSCNKFERKKTE